MQKTNRKKVVVSLFFLAVLISFGVLGTVSFLKEANGGDDFEFKWIIPPENHSGNSFHDDRAWVRHERDGNWTLYDNNGNVIKKEFEARMIFDYKNGYAAFDEKIGMFGGHIGFLDISGDVAFPPLFSSLGVSYSEGLTKLHDRGLFGFANMQGEWIVAPKYENVRDFKEGLAAVKNKEGKWGYIDKNGEKVVGFIFDDASSFKNGKSIVLKDSRLGVIDKAGNFIVEPVYKSKFLFWDDGTWDEPLGIIKDDKVGFINTSGKVVIDFKFTNTDDSDINRSSKLGFNNFSNGRAAVVLDSPEAERAIIDESGDVIFLLKENLFFGFAAYRDEYIIGRRKKEDKVEVLIYDKNGREYDVSKYIDFNSNLMLSNKIFRSYPDIMTDKKTTGYFILKPKGEK